MAIVAANYPAPVQVNGYSCRNCSEVSLATKGIDPKHPQSGPANRTADRDPTRSENDPAKLESARRAAEVIMRTPVGYSPTGAIGGKIAPGRIISASA
jgi:hypothetical protein